MHVPNEPTSGSPISSQWGRQVVQFMRDLDRRIREIRSQEVKKGAPAQASRRTPFQVIQFSDDDGNDYIGVAHDSHLFNSTDKDTYEEDNSEWGLLAQNPGEGATAGGIDVDDLNSGDKIWLEIVLTPSQVVDVINVRHGQVGEEGAWLDYPDPIGISSDDEGNPYQETYNQIIAEITDPPDNEDPRESFVVTQGEGDDAVNLHVVQLLTTNVMLVKAHTTADADDPFVPLRVAIPSHAPGTSADGEADSLAGDDDSMTPYALGETDEERFAFKLLDGSDDEGAKVRILDGEVYETLHEDHESVTPDGMGDDDLTLLVSNDDEVWLQINLGTAYPGEIMSVLVDTGDNVPDDTDETKYVRIGYVTVDESGEKPVVTPTNTLLGDYIMPLSIDVNGTNVEGEDESFGDVNQFNMEGAVYIARDDEENEDAVTFYVGPDVADEDDHSIDNPKRIVFTRDASDDGDDPIVENTSSGDDEDEEVTVHIGSNVNGPDGDGDDNSVDGVHQFDFVGAVTLEDGDDPNSCVLYVGPDVSDEIEGNNVDNPSSIVFSLGRPDDANQVVEETEEGEAKVYITSLNIRDDNEGSVARVGGIRFTTEPADDDGVIVEPDDTGLEGDALVHIGGALDVGFEDQDPVEGVGTITFQIIGGTDEEDVGEEGMVIEGDDGEAVVVLGVSQQITGAVNGVPSTANVLFDPTVNNGQWEPIDDGDGP